MDKPISITVENAKKEIIECINGLHLSPTILEYIVRDVYEEVKNAHIIELQNDLRNHNTLEKENKDRSKT